MHKIFLIFIISISQAFVSPIALASTSELEKNLNSIEPENKYLQDQLEEIKKLVLEYQRKPRRLFYGKGTRDQETIDYVNLIYKIIDNQIAVFSKSLDGSGRQTGTAIITISIDSAGYVGELEIRRSSDWPAFDKTVIKAINSISPFPKFPANLKKHEDLIVLTRPFSYKVFRNDQ